MKEKELIERLSTATGIPAKNLKRSLEAYADNQDDLPWTYEDWATDQAMLKKPFGMEPQAFLTKFKEIYHD